MAVDGVAGTVLIYFAVAVSLGYLYTAPSGLFPIASKRSLLLWLGAGTIGFFLLDVGPSVGNGWRAGMSFAAWLAYLGGALLRWLPPLAKRLQKSRAESDGTSSTPQA